MLVGTKGHEEAEELDYSVGRETKTMQKQIKKYPYFLLLDLPPEG